VPDPDAERPPRRRPQQTAAPTARGVASGAATHASHGAARLGTSWRGLSGEYRLAAAAAVGLFVSMFLPWYEQTATGVVAGKPVAATNSLSAFQVFSWVEAAVLVVAVAVLALCFTRGERRSFHLPGGDGSVIFAGGVWVCFLVFVRQLDKPEPDHVPTLTATMGVQWGIFVCFLFGLLLAYAGLRLRAAHRPEPGPLDEAIATGRAPRERPRRPPAEPFDDDDDEPEPEARTAVDDRGEDDTAVLGAGETKVMLPDEAPTGVVARDAPPPPPKHGEQLRLDD